MKSGIVNFTYSDDLDEYRVAYRGRALGRRLAADGPETIADAMVAEFRQIDARRTEALELLKGSMAALEHICDDDDRITMWFGREAREYEFKIGRALSLKLRRSTISQILNHYKQEHYRRSADGHDQRAADRAVSRDWLLRDRRCFRRPAAYRHG